MTDHILKGKSVCMTIKNADDKWVEIMAASKQGSSGGSYCVADWGAEGLHEVCSHCHPYVCLFPLPPYFVCYHCDPNVCLSVWLLRVRERCVYGFFWLAIVAVSC
jgi:hypothetical protein